MLAPDGDKVLAMDGSAFAGTSGSWEDPIPCVASDSDYADVWVGRMTGGGAFGMGCFGSASIDEGIAVFDLGDDGLAIVANSSTPGTGDLATLEEEDDCFLARVNNAYELVSVKSIPTPRLGAANTPAVAAARAPDGSIIVVGNLEQSRGRERPGLLRFQHLGHTRHARLSGRAAAHGV